MVQQIQVLLLDKDCSGTNSIRRMLECEQVDIDYSSSVDDCLERLSQSSFDLLVLACSASENIKVLVERPHLNCLLPSIMLLDEYVGNVVMEAMHLGCLDVVIKQQDYLQLLQLKIERFVENRRQSIRLSVIEDELRSCKKVAERVQSIAKVGNWEYYLGTRVAKWSPQEFRNFGYEVDSVAPTYDKYIEAIHPDDRDLVEQLNVCCVDQHKPAEFIFRVLLGADNIRYLRAITEVDVNQKDEVVRIFGVSQDITEQVKNEASLNQAATVFETATEAIFITDSSDTIVSINPAFTEITGYSREQAVGKKRTILSSEVHDAQFFYDFWAELKRQGAWQGEICNRHKDGHIFPTWHSVSAVKDSEGNIVQYVSIFSDISKRKESESLIRYQANYDALTDLPNRTLFGDRMSLAIKQAQRSGSQIAMMLMDLDRFKWVNDTLGHSAGDAVLKETARCLKQAVRSSDTVARIGGDEFIVILADLKKSSDAMAIAKKILAGFVKPVHIDGHEVFISGSIGISVYPGDGEDVETLQKNADSAMYSAKEAGRNQVHFYTPLLQAEAERRMLLITYLRRAIERQEFSVVYQPIIDVTENSIASAEALIRWQQPQLGFVSPAEFIPLAEETGLIQSIGQWVVRHVAEDMQRWQKAELGHIQISINKSPKQFIAGECGDWQNVFAEYDVPLSNITVEITESLFMEKAPHYLETLINMQAAGIKISLDDFGTGYCSLSYLKRFPVDILKIDKEFIDDLNTDPSDALLVETIVTLAEKMKIKVVAEGVETKEQLDFLKRIHCQFVQGYYFSKPLSRAEFEHYLDK